MRVDAVVVGAGQAGLATAWHLKDSGMSFRLLEAGDQPGGAWQAYYDSLKLFSPAAYSGLPGLPFPGAPGRYPHRNDVVDYLQDYAGHFSLPVETNRRVLRVERENAGFRVETGDGEIIHAHCVIAASGAFANPYIPPLPGLDGFRGRHLHSAQYRNTQGFEGKRIVVIGGANSAVQIARELARVARVTLATRRPIRFVPQRILGRDFHFWLRLTRLDFTRWLDDQSTPVLDDGSYRQAVAAGCPDRRPMFTHILPDAVQWADGSREPVDVLLFATGFRPQLPYLSALDVTDADGRLEQKNGIARNIPGLYFVGFPKQRNFASATLRGVGPDAAHVIGHLRRHLARARLAENPGRAELGRVQ